MSLPVFVHDLDSYLDGEKVVLPREGESVTLRGPEGRHAVSVKRIGVGEQIELMDTRGAKALVTVTSVAGKDTLTGTVDEVVVAQEPQPTVTVAQAIPKSERSELAVDLLTQGGVDCIIPWEATRCVSKWQGSKRSKGVQKWRQAATSAAKQSRRATIPEVRAPHNTEELLPLIREFDSVFVLHETAASSFRDALEQAEVTSAKNILLIIGPEGGVTDNEAQKFRDAGAFAVKLGPEVLRTATAGLVALAVIGVFTERW